MAEAFAWMWGFGGGLFVGVMLGAGLAYTSRGTAAVSDRIPAHRAPDQIKAAGETALQQDRNRNPLCPSCGMRTGHLARCSSSGVLVDRGVPRG